MYKLVIFLKKIGLNRIALTLGYANWIIVITVLVTIFVQQNKVSTTADVIMINYVRFSYIPSLTSLILTIKVNKEYKALNLTINILFILLYILVYMFASYMSRHG